MSVAMRSSVVFVVLSVGGVLTEEGGDGLTGRKRSSCGRAGS